MKYKNNGREFSSRLHPLILLIYLYYVAVWSMFISQYFYPFSMVFLYQYVFNKMTITWYIKVIIIVYLIINHECNVVNDKM